MYITREGKYTKEREKNLNIALKKKKKNDNEIKVIVKYDKNNRPAKEKRKLLQRLKLMSNRTKSENCPSAKKFTKRKPISRNSRGPSRTTASRPLILSNSYQTFIPRGQSSPGNINQVVSSVRPPLP